MSHHTTLFTDQTSLHKSFRISLARQMMRTETIDRFDKKQEDIAKQIIQYIHIHFREPLSNRQIAEKFHFHPNYISQLMKTHTGMTLYQYILNVKLTNAVDLLLTTDINVGDISSSLGFDNIHYFSALFKKKMGVSPSRFRWRVSEQA